MTQGSGSGPAGQRRSTGSGPGAIAGDGCAVDFYALLPAGWPEARIIHSAVAPGAAILELGCGTGRITHPLTELGHRVTAVDESAEMLAHVREAETVRSRIEDLRLGRRFGAVLLASHLVNAGAATRRTFLRACRSHVAENGCVIIQQHPPAWFDTAAESDRAEGGISFRLRDVSRPAPGLLSATVEYQVGDRVWRQTFTAERLSDGALADTLAESGLVLDAYLTEDRAWLRAVPAAA